jgi:hypothetical protein
VVSILIIFLLFILQFVYFPVGFSHFEAPKVYTAETAIFLLVLLTVFNQSSISLKHFNKKFLAAAAVLVLLSFIHLIFFLTPTAFSGNAFRLQGIFLLWMLICFAFLSSRVSFEKKLHPLIILGCLIMQLLFALIIDGGVNERAVGTLGEPNALASVTVFIWPFLFFNQKKLPLYSKITALLIAATFILL